MCADSAQISSEDSAGGKNKFCGRRTLAMIAPEASEKTSHKRVASRHTLVVTDDAQVAARTPFS